SYRTSRVVRTEASCGGDSSALTTGRAASLKGAIRQFITGTAAAVTAAPATFTVRALAIGAACRSGSGTRTHRSHPSVRQHAFSTCAFFPQHVHEGFPSPKFRHTCPVGSAAIPSCTSSAAKARKKAIVRIITVSNSSYAPRPTPDAPHKTPYLDRPLPP